MNIEINGDYRMNRLNEDGGIIYQTNFYSIGEIMFSYFTADYADPVNIYSDCNYTVARFIVKSKNPS